MNEIIYTAIRLVVMGTAVMVARYLVPWIQASIDHQRFDEAMTWVREAVMCAQQLLADTATGAERKQTVMIFLQRLLEEKGINMTDEQLNTLVEAAVKQMKISEGR